MPENPLEQETSQVTRYSFECPNCHERSDGIGTSTPVDTHEYGSISMERIATSPDVDIDEFEESWSDMSDERSYGERIYECSSCGNAIDKDEIRQNIRTETEEVIIPRMRKVIFKPRQNEETQIPESPDRYIVLSGRESGMARDPARMPETFSPEVIDPYQERKSGYDYAHLAECPNCQNEFMIGKTEINVTCPKCSHEFKTEPLIKSYDPQNARQRSEVFDSFHSGN